MRCPKCGSVNVNVQIVEKHSLSKKGNGGWGNDGVLKNVYRHAMTGKAQEMNKIANTYFSEMQHEMQHEKKEP